jgi:rhodanese-related sulfurtransferase
MSFLNGVGYAGDVAPREAWSSLSSDARAILVDVRTRAEWSFVGVPSLGEIGKSPITLEGQVFPSMAVNPYFVSVLDGALTKAAVEHDAPIYFLCRSGVRSKSAAIAMTEAGWEQCFNIASGFEGPPDATGHRGQVEGWKAQGLPWTQS